ncbi:hypothetical protein KC19_VG140400 [Ceratodon purpureus]|uniref:Uncharacterized protein n=1 Tax=Ceratodon purpureus TaxID=3225 RepID=A0A8T0HR29_CERPU|nr:hypothetical protein KC19_VG140400 [Ceratodon purpureus]
MSKRRLVHIQALDNVNNNSICKLLPYKLRLDGVWFLIHNRVQPCNGTLNLGVLHISKTETRFISMWPKHTCKVGVEDFYSVGIHLWIDPCTIQSEPIPKVL